MRKTLALLLALLTLLCLTACGEETTPAATEAPAAEATAPAETPEPQPYPILGQTRLEDCTLAVHYVDADVYFYYPLTLEGLLADESDERDTHHMTVPGTELLENERFLALLEELDPEELPPEQDLANYSSRITPTVYYVLTDQNGKKLFDVGMGWDNVEDGGYLIESVNFNGEKIPFDERFYFCVEPYLLYSHYVTGFCTVEFMAERPPITSSDGSISNTPAEYMDAKSRSIPANYEGMGIPAADHGRFQRELWGLDYEGYRFSYDFSGVKMYRTMLCTEKDGIFFTIIIACSGADETEEILAGFYPWP
ncbi:MAG: hypothetical protein IJK63_08630 [Oscillospiraceae bacterium]|nr:hypothetical protein [Oscillospiraceae bacterium]